MISYDDFRKVELRAVKIVAAERVEGSAKLLRLKADLGGEQRQIVAGIGKRYAPDALIGKHIIIVANLMPRELMGFESRGMLLAADGPDGPVVLIPDGEVASGTVIG